MPQITSAAHDAVLFDMDGVLTDTATLHATAWKKVLDDVLRTHAQTHNVPFVPFDAEHDYHIHVDGKRRHEGVRAFLDHRDIHIPSGHPDSPPDEHSHYGIGNRKDSLVNAILDTDGVQVYDDAIRLVRALRAHGAMKTAVVSSSKNCLTVLRAARIEDLFDARVDGLVADTRHLPGKPHPAMFLEAARELAVSPSRAVVIEDALAGVAAGKAGGFALVVGIARGKDATPLRDAGADVVIDDLGPWADSWEHDHAG